MQILKGPKPTQYIDCLIHQEMHDEGSSSKSKLGKNCQEIIHMTNLNDRGAFINFNCNNNIYKHLQDCYVLASFLG